MRPNDLLEAASGTNDKNKETKLGQRLRSMYGRLPFGRFFVRLVIFFSVFFMVTQAVNWQTYRFLEKSSEAMLQNSYENIADVATLSINRIFMEIYQSNTLVGLNPAAREVFSTYHTIDDLEDYFQIPGVIRALSTVSTISDYIDTVSIYKRDSDIVISDKAMYSSTEYFEQYHAYEAYSAGFWSGHLPSTPFEVMRPTQLQTSAGHKSVLPVVQTKIYDMPSKNLYIVDLDLDKIENMLNEYRATGHSMILITNREQDQLLFHTSLPEGFDSEGFLGKLRENPSSRYYLDYAGEDYFILTYDADLFFTKVKMATCVPKADISETINSGYPYRIIMNVFLLLMAVLLIALFSRKAYEPLGTLVHSLGASPPQEGGPQDEIALIRSRFQQQRADLAEAQDKLSYTSHLAREQLLHKMFLGQKLTPEEAGHLEEMFPQTPEAGYAFLLIKPVYRDSLHQAYPPAFADNLFLTLKAVITEFFAASESAQVFETAPNRICVLASGPESHAQWLKERAAQVIRLFEADEEQLSLFIVISSLCADRVGLAQAYQQAEYSLSSLSPFYRSCVWDASHCASSLEFELSPQFEHKLTNLIAAGKKESALSFLCEELLNSEHLAKLSVPGLQKLFMQLYFIAVKALKEKGKTCDQSVYEQFATFSAQMDTKSLKAIRDFLYDFFYDVIDRYQATPMALTSELFKSYIDENYFKDLSLEYLAQKYNTSAQYISRLLKKELGMPFQTYLHQLRISKAKDLLVNSHLSVTQIYEKVGYNSRNTFIRSFKAVEGVTPSEYRHLWRDGASPAGEEEETK